jgi:hypothetical protein
VAEGEGAGAGSTEGAGAAAAGSTRGVALLPDAATAALLAAAAGEACSALPVASGAAE